MYVVCLKENGSYFCKLDREGFSTSTKLRDALFVDSKFGVYSLVLFLSEVTDFDVDDFYIQFVTLEDFN